MATAIKEPSSVRAIITRQVQLKRENGERYWAQPGDTVTIPAALFGDLRSGNKAREYKDEDERAQGELEAEAQKTATAARIESKKPVPAKKEVK